VFYILDEFAFFIKSFNPLLILFSISEAWGD